MKTLAIIGASGHGKVVADTAIQCGWTHIIYFDDAWPTLTTHGKWPVLGTPETLTQHLQGFSAIIVAIGDNHIRLHKSLALQKAALPLASLIHPNAYVASDTHIEDGSIICAGAIVQPGTSIGLAGIVNTIATVDHDCSLASGVHISPGANLAGSVSVGECTWVGIGASINQSLSVGANVVIGASAAVTKDISDGVKVIGIPAKKICL